MTVVFPPAAPVSGRPGKLGRKPSNDSESAVTSAKTPSVSPRRSSRTVPRTELAGPSPSRWRSVPLNWASRYGPVRVPAASSTPFNVTAGARRCTVRRSTVAASTPNPRNAKPPDNRSTSPWPRSRVSGHPATSESRKLQSTSRASRLKAPSARVWPVSRP